MHILALMLLALVFAGVWYWRLRMASRLIVDVGDMASTLRGRWRRRRFVARSDRAAIESIVDPRTAAAVLLAGVAEAGWTASEEDEKAIERWLADVAEDDKAAETVVFARWAMRQGRDFRSVLRILSPLLVRSLAEGERLQLLDAADFVARRRGDATPEQEDAIGALRRSFGLDRVRAAAR